MSEDFAKVLPTLIKLSEVDSSLARILAKHKQLDLEQEDASKAFNLTKREFEDKKLDLDKRKGKYLEEEKRINEENEKLVERRKVLSSFTNYKVQQSAQKEIELAAKQLSAQEEKLLSTLEETEALEKEVEELKLKYSEEEKKLKELSSSAEEEIDALLARAKEKEAERSELAATVDPKNLTMYERIRVKHPADPLVAVREGNCGGCFMQVGPQMMVQISRADSLVKCRGCGRLLFLSSDEADQDSNSPAA